MRFRATWQGRRRWRFGSQSANTPRSPKKLDSHVLDSQRFHAPALGDKPHARMAIAAVRRREANTAAPEEIGSFRQGREHRAGRQPSDGMTFHLDASNQVEAAHDD